MKILYLLFSFTIGGTERLVADICNEMVEQQQEVYLYIVNDFYSKEIIKTLSEKVHIELQHRQVGSGEKAYTIKRVTEYIRKNQIDVIHCNSLDAPELLILKSLCFRTTKIVHTVHDVGQYASLPKWKIFLRNQLCDCFVAISESVKVDIVKYGAKASKTTTIYNAINLNKFQNDKSKEFDLNRVVLGNVARFMPEKKGQDVLINAVAEVKKKYPNIICYFAGGCDERHKVAFEKMQQIVHKLGLEENIVFWGNVNDIPTFLRTLDIFVLPSRFEGFGISLIEAMAMGLPCIASNLDGPAEIIGNNERGFLFRCGDSHDLAEKIIRIISEYQAHKKNADKWTAYVQSHFSISSMCNLLIEVYERC